MSRKDSDSFGYLEAASGHLDKAIEAHEAGEHHACRYRIGQARAAVRCAIETHPQAPGVDPTAATGAQASNGQQPRGAEDWARRLFGAGRTR